MKESQQSSTSLHYDTAFAEAYRTFYPRIFAFIYNQVCSTEIAQDLTADIFERAYTRGHDLREEAAYPAWLFKIAKNVAASYHRSQKTRSQKFDRMKHSLYQPEARYGPEELVISNEARKRVRRHLLSLTYRDQRLLSLKFDGELTNAEIAGVLGISEVNVRVGIFRALKKLQSLVAEEDRL